MDTTYKTTLELDKVLARAVQLCACQETKEMMQALQPAPTVEDERYDLAQTNAINALLIKNGSPRFGSVREPRRSTRVQLDKTRKTSMELNLLGYTVDEALNEVDKFLDSGMLRGQSTLYIIHGNGTGALRTAIQKHLRTHKAVKSFRLGRYGEGESGVTVVELK